MRNFTNLLLSDYKNHPQKNIIFFQKSGLPDTEISYRSLVAGAANYSEMLQEKGILPGEVVIIILQHSLDLIYSYFGILFNGSIPSIMPFLTEKLRPEKYRNDLDALIRITRPSAIITYKEFEQEVSHLINTKTSVKTVIFAEDVENVDKGEDLKNWDPPGKNRHPESVVLLQHSSGTTGLQKGVALSHQAVFNQIDSYRQAIQLEEDDVIVSWLPLYHDMGLIASFLMPILTRTPLVLMSPFDWVRAPYKLLNAVSEYSGTLSWLPNFAYNFCAKKIRETDIEGVNLGSLRALINCSEPIRYESHQLFLNRFRDYGFKESALATSYAMAENVFAVTQGGINEPIKFDEIDLELFQKEKVAKQPVRESLTEKMVSSGKPIMGTEIKIVDDGGQELPERSVGEVLIRSDCMLTGYYRRDDETRRSMVNGWFKTGDLGYFAEGELFVSGRKKDLIIVGGKNIYPQDIEDIVMEVSGIHPGRAVAFGIYNDLKGTEDVVVIAEVEELFRDNKDKIAQEIRKTITQNTAVTLRTVYLVPEKWLIKTSSGKIARTANKEKFQKETSTEK